MALALRTKPHTNAWCFLSPRVCTLGEDAFEHAPVVIKEIHTYLKNLLNERELAGNMMLQLMQDGNTMSLEKHQADILATRAQYERSDAILGGMGVGCTPSFLSTCYPRASRNLIASFVKDIRKLSIGLVLALYVTFGHENFVRGPANLFTGGPEIGWSPCPDRHVIWSGGRFVREVTLPRTTAGSELRIQHAVGNRLIQEYEGLEDTLAPVPPATE